MFRVLQNHKTITPEERYNAAMKRASEMKFRYGAVSSVYELEANNKLTAYAAMCAHFNRSAHLIALYEPKEIVKNDSWLNPMGAIAKRLDEIFGGDGSFDRYMEEHREEIIKAYNTINQVL